MRINGYARYKVMDIEKALLQNKDYERQLYVDTKWYKDLVNLIILVPSWFKKTAK